MLISQYGGSTMVTNITIHGSILRDPKTASDIDVVYAADNYRDAAEVDEVVRKYAAEQGWTQLPLDVQHFGCVPAVPLDENPAQLQLRGDPLRRRTMFDFAAWVRCVHRFGDAGFAAYCAALDADTNVDSRWLLVNGHTPRVVLVPLQGNLHESGYEGGGPAALQKARRKCPAAWALCLAAFERNILVGDLINAVADGVFTEFRRTHAKLSAHMRGAPAGSHGQVVLYRSGIGTDYLGFKGWEALV